VHVSTAQQIRFVFAHHATALQRFCPNKRNPSPQTSLLTILEPDKVTKLKARRNQKLRASWTFSLLSINSMENRKLLIP
jgi:hypothetical protein